MMTSAKEPGITAEQLRKPVVMDMSCATLSKGLTLARPHTNPSPKPDPNPNPKTNQVCHAVQGRVRGRRIRAYVPQRGARRPGALRVRSGAGRGMAHLHPSAAPDRRAAAAARDTPLRYAAGGVHRVGEIARDRDPPHVARVRHLPGQQARRHHQGVRGARQGQLRQACSTDSLTYLLTSSPPYQLLTNLQASSSTRRSPSSPVASSTAVSPPRRASVRSSASLTRMATAQSRSRRCCPACRRRTSGCTTS